MALLAKMGPEQAIADIHKTMANHPLKDRIAEQPMLAGQRVTKPESEGKAAGKKEKKTQSKGEAKKPKKSAAAADKPQKFSALDAAAKVLAEKGEPMTCKEMIEAMAKKGYWQSPGGKTPDATLYSGILRELKVKGKEARFEKVARGKFALRQSETRSASAAGPACRGLFSLARARLRYRRESPRGGRRSPHLSRENPPKSANTRPDSP